MNWKKVIPIILLVVVTTLAADGCSNGGKTTPATTATSSTLATPITPAAPATATPAPIGGTGNNTAHPPFVDSNNMTALPQGGNQGGQPTMSTIDYAAAAKTLGVTEQALRDALGDITKGMPDFNAAAQKLGVTVEALLKVLGLTQTPSPPSSTNMTGGGTPP